MECMPAAPAKAALSQLAVLACRHATPSTCLRLEVARKLKWVGCRSTICKIDVRVVACSCVPPADARLKPLSAIEHPTA